LGFGRQRGGEGSRESTVTVSGALLGGVVGVWSFLAGSGRQDDDAI